MAKTNPLGFRVDPEVKTSLERAAKADRRSVSSLVEKILYDWLREHGHLSAPDGSSSGGAGGSKKPQRQSVAAEKLSPRKAPRAKPLAMSKEARLRSLRERGF